MRPLLTLALLLFCLSAQAREPKNRSTGKPANAPQAQTTGPANGSLLIAGGGGKAMDILFGRFLELAGGKDAPIVIVPTAASTDPKYPYFNHRLLKTAREDFGATDVTILHTHDPAEADKKSFVAPLRRASGIWFTGGRQWRIADAYLGTRTEREFRKVLDRGGVIAGSSAGATIQGSFLFRGDTRGPHILIGDHQQGLGYLTNSAIDQHLIPRKRQYDLLTALADEKGRMEKSIDREALLGIGIDEDTAIVVKGNHLEVIGKPSGVVYIYDPRKWTDETPRDEKYLILKVGDRYDLAKRQQIPEK